MGIEIPQPLRFLRNSITILEPILNQQGFFSHCSTGRKNEGPGSLLINIPSTKFGNQRTIPFIVPWKWDNTNFDHLPSSSPQLSFQAIPGTTSSRNMSQPWDLLIFIPARVLYTWTCEVILPRKLTMNHGPKIQPFLDDFPMKNIEKSSVRAFPCWTRSAPWLKIYGRWFPISDENLTYTIPVTDVDREHSPILDKKSIFNPNSCGCPKNVSTRKTSKNKQKIITIWNNHCDSGIPPLQEPPLF